MLKKTLLALTLTASLFACKDDDKEKECVAPAMSQHIVNKWDATLGTGAVSLGPYNFTFTQDGTIQGPIDALLKIYLPNIEIDEIVRYSVKDEKTIEVVATSAGQALPPVSLNVKESTCEKVTLSLDTYTLTLQK